MSPELFSFINKLPEDNSSKQLEFSGSNLTKKYKELKSRLPDLQDSILTLIAFLTQYLDLSNFTDDELYSLSTLNLYLLEVNQISYSNKTLNSNRPLFDSSSSRIYRLVNSQNITSFMNFRRGQSFLFSNSRNIKELILFLANGGY